MKKKNIIILIIVAIGVITFLTPLIIHLIHNAEISKELCESTINGDIFMLPCPKEALPDFYKQIQLIGVFIILAGLSFKGSNTSFGFLYIPIWMFGITVFDELFIHSGIQILASPFLLIFFAICSQCAIMGMDLLKSVNRAIDICIAKISIYSFMVVLLAIFDKNKNLFVALIIMLLIAIITNAFYIGMLKEDYGTLIKKEQKVRDKKRFESSKRGVK